ncbi:unnamed protein product [Coregonus sp. 'balchen']|nr:unnamed protein product [Coregonus sp. 'balchen']
MASVQKNGKHTCGGFLITADFVLTAAHCDKSNLTVIGTHNIKKGPEMAVRYSVEHKCNPNYEDVDTVVDVTTIVLKVCQKDWRKLSPKVICAGGYLTKNGFCQGDSGGPLVFNGKAVGLISFNSDVNCDYPYMPNVYSQISKFLPWKKGDSGGPLVFNGKAVGLISFNSDVNRDYPYMPNVYSQISKFLPWKKVINKKICTDGRKVPKVGIVGGREAARNSRPYMASLQSRGQHDCGGVLVREDFVLTAAHCDGRYRVVLGAHDLSEDENSQQVLDVVKYIPHPRYGDNLENDVMLLKLRGRATLNRAVQLIPLMNGSMAEGSMCTTAGWGDIDDNDNSPDKLQEVNATIIPPRECARKWSGINISSRVVCATGPSAFQGFCSV